MEHRFHRLNRHVSLAALSLVMASLLGFAAAQSTSLEGLTQSTHVTYGGVDVAVEAIWVTPATAAELLQEDSGAWSADTGIVLLVHESTSAKALPSAVLGSASVLAVEGRGVRPEVIGLVATDPASRVTLVRFPVSPSQKGKIALNVPGRGVLVWNVEECLGAK